MKTREALVNMIGWALDWAFDVQRLLILLVRRIHTSRSF